jgi:RNA polymerase-binding transcription factor DksA
MPRPHNATVPPSPFPPQELAQWRATLVNARSDIRGTLAALHEETIVSESVSVSSNHLAEGASDAQNQDLSLSAADGEQDLLREIDRAIFKIDHGKPVPFGVCEHTKEPIARERLQLMPWTPFSTKGAEYQEQNHLTIDDMTEPE